MRNLRELVIQQVRFVAYRRGVFMYRTADGFEFAVPADELGDATLKAEDKGIYFMRWIRAQLEYIASRESVAA